jgi:hypothetical protein
VSPEHRLYVSATSPPFAASIAGQTWQPRDLAVHDARRTCGSLLATLEVHPRVAMQILRHSKIAVTIEIYTEVPSAAP